MGLLSKFLGNKYKKRPIPDIVEDIAENVEELVEEIVESFEDGIERFLGCEDNDSYDNP